MISATVLPKVLTCVNFYVALLRHTERNVNWLISAVVQTLCRSVGRQTFKTRVKACKLTIL